MTTTTFIDSGKCARVRGTGNSGEFAEIVNNALCGASNVVGSLRWLGNGETLQAGGEAGFTQLVYLMEGNGVITLGGKDYEVGQGAGVFLDLGEEASVSNRTGQTLKLFHLVVPEAKD